MGYFEVQIEKIQNTAGELSNGKCCDGLKNLEGKCNLNECDTFVRVCLKEYQSSSSEHDSESCTFGSSMSGHLGGNSFTIANTDDPDNKGRIKIPIKFTWMVSIEYVMYLWL